MNKQLESFRSGLESTSAGAKRTLWPRAGRTVVLVLTYLVTEILIKIIVIAQFAIAAFRGSPSRWLRRRGEELSRQIHDMWLYLSFAAPEAPWPFSTWPRASPDIVPDTAPPPPEHHGDDVRAPSPHTPRRGAVMPASTPGTAAGQRR